MDDYDKYRDNLLNPKPLGTTDPKVIAKNYFKKWLKGKETLVIEDGAEYEYCNDIVYADPKKGFEVVVELINACKNFNECKEKYRWVYSIAAGELEVLISNFGDLIVEDLIKEMKSNDLFLIACTGVWTLGRPSNDPMWIRFQKEIKENIQINPRVKKTMKKYIN